MSKNKNYQNFYNAPVTEEVPNVSEEVVKDIHTDEQAKEEANTEETREEAPHTKRAKVAGAKLVNMRENPNKSATVIDKLKEGTIVELGESTVVGPEWSHIKYGNKTGFMMSMFLKEI